MPNKPYVMHSKLTSGASAMLDELAYTLTADKFMECMVTIDALAGLDGQGYRTATRNDVERARAEVQAERLTLSFHCANEQCGDGQPSHFTNLELFQAGGFIYCDTCGKPLRMDFESRCALAQRNSRPNTFMG